MTMAMLPRRSPAFTRFTLLPQAAADGLVCEGTCAFSNGIETLDAMFGEAPENSALATDRCTPNSGAWPGQFMGKPRCEGVNEVEISQCGRQFVLATGSKRMPFLQSMMDNTLSGAQNIATNEAELTLRVVDYKGMFDKVEGRSQGFAFNSPVAMGPRKDSMPAADKSRWHQRCAGRSCGCNDEPCEKPRYAKGKHNGSGCDTDAADESYHAIGALLTGLY